MSFTEGEFCQTSPYENNLIGAGVSYFEKQ